MWQRVFHYLFVATPIYMCVVSVGVVDASTSYEYDTQHRLAKVTYDGGTVVAYTYDASGNRLSRTVTRTSPPVEGVGYTRIALRRIDRWVYEYEYRMTVRNRGDQTLQNIVGTAKAYSEWITMVDGQVGFGDLEPGQTAVSGDTFTFRVDRRHLEDLPPDWPITWEFTYTLAGNPQQASVTLPLNPNAAPGDFDADGDVGTSDLAVFEQCASGPAIPYSAGTACQQADLDIDGDIDQSDFGIFQRCYSGEDVPADPSCGN